MKFYILHTIFLFSLLAGCAAQPTPTVALTAGPAATDTMGPKEQASLEDVVGNLEYSGILYDRPIKLNHGYANYEDGGSQLPYVELAGNLIPSGDLNGDGAEDAVAVLIDNTTGTGDFVYFVPVLDVRSEPEPLQALLIGDRTPLKSLIIEGGQVAAELIMHGPGEPLCCPSLNVRKSFSLEGNTLVEQSSQELGKVNLADLDGTNWRLVDLNHDQEPLLPETEITLGFDDGQISGFAGCNDYSSPVTGDEELPQTFLVGPVAATKKICPDPVSNQEMDYLTRLENVLLWRFAFGYLSLVYRLGESEFGELFFAPRTQ